MYVSVDYDVPINDARKITIQNCNRAILVTL